MRGKRDCPPSASGCENKIDKEINLAPPNSYSDDEEYNIINSDDKDVPSDPSKLSLSQVKDHRRLLGAILPFEQQSRPDVELSSAIVPSPSLKSSFVRGGGNAWNSTFSRNSHSASKFTAVIFTQLSATSPAVHYNAPIFKLVSNVAASQYVDKVI